MGSEQMLVVRKKLNRKYDRVLNSRTASPREKIRARIARPITPASKNSYDQRRRGVTE